MEISRIYKSEEPGNPSILSMAVRWNDVTCNRSTALKQQPHFTHLPCPKNNWVGPIGLTQALITRDGLRFRLYHLQPV